MYKFLSVICLSFTLTPVTGFSQSPLQKYGTLEGVVFNASVASETGTKTGVYNQDVVLYKYIDGKADENTRVHIATDSRGRFRFGQLPVGKRFAYYPATVFNGIEYYGDLVTFTSDTLKRYGDVIVYDNSRSDSSIVVSMQHFIIKPGIGVLEVKEISIFENRSLFTYVGNEPAGKPGKNIVLRMEVPENAKDVQIGGDLMSCCAIVKGNQIFDSMEFKPGIRKEIVKYLLPYQGETAILDKSITSPTASVDVFLPENSGTLTSPEFIKKGSFRIGAGTYIRYSTNMVSQGNRLTLSFENLTPGPHDWRWLPPALLGLVIFTGSFIYLRRVKNRTSKNEHPSAMSENRNLEKRQLLQEILHLEEAFETGKIDESIYSEQRKKQIALLEEIEEKNKQVLSNGLNNSKEK